MSSNSTLSGKVAGGLVVGIGCVGIAGYVPILVTIAVTRAMISSPFYVFLTSLGVTDCIALVCWICLGLDFLFDGAPFGPRIENIAIKTIFFCWYSLILHLLLLAFNRYCSVVRLKWHTRLFERGVQPRHWVASVIVIAMAASLPAFIGCETFTGFAYTFEIICSGPTAFTITTAMDIGMSSLVFVLVVPLYALIWREVRTSMRKVASHSSGVSGTESKQARERKWKNVKLGVQALFVSLFFYVYNSAFYLVFLGGFDIGEWGIFFIFTFLCALNSAINPFVYFIFNSTLRARVKELVKICNTKGQVHPQPPMLN